LGSVLAISLRTVTGTGFCERHGEFRIFKGMAIGKASWQKQESPSHQGGGLAFQSKRFGIATVASRSFLVLLTQGILGCSRSSILKRHTQ